MSVKELIFQQDLKLGKQNEGITQQREWVVCALNSPRSDGAQGVLVYEMSSAHVHSARPIPYLVPVIEQGYPKEAASLFLSKVERFCPIALAPKREKVCIWSL